MNRLAIYTLLIVTLAGCAKEHDIVNTQSSDSPIIFSTQIEPIATTKGTALTTVDSDNFQTEGRKFSVGVYVTPYDKEAGTAPVSYFTYNSSPFLNVSYTTENGWSYTNGKTYYWPTDEDKKLTFAAAYPSTNYCAYDQYGFSISHTAYATVANQDDLLYAYHEDVGYGTDGTVALEFHHALSQIAFTAQIADDLDGKDDLKPKIDVTIKSIEICNVEHSGNFYIYSENSTLWVNTYEETYGVTDYSTPLVSENGIELDYSAETLSHATDVLMLIPLDIIPWDPELTETLESTKREDYGTYLKINCKITQTIESSDGESDTTTVHDGYLYVPFSDYGVTYTDDSSFTDRWRPGYIITYNLIFGGGYSTPPGTSTPVFTLSEFQYEVTTEKWKESDDIDIDTTDKSIGLKYTVAAMTQGPEYEVDMEDGETTQK